MPDTEYEQGPLTLGEAAAAYANADAAMQELKARRKRKLDELQEIDDFIASTQVSVDKAKQALDNAR